jgi:hypothetical protein
MQILQAPLGIQFPLLGQRVSLSRGLSRPLATEAKFKLGMYYAAEPIHFLSNDLSAQYELREEAPLSEAVNHFADRPDTASLVDQISVPENAGMSSLEFHSQSHAIHSSSEPEPIESPLTSTDRPIAAEQVMPRSQKKTSSRKTSQSKRQPTVQSGSVEINRQTEQPTKSKKNSRKSQPTRPKRQDLLSELPSSEISAFDESADLLAIATFQNHLPPEPLQSSQLLPSAEDTILENESVSSPPIATRSESLPILLETSTAPHEEVVQASLYPIVSSSEDVSSENLITNEHQNRSVRQDNIANDPQAINPVKKPRNRKTSSRRSAPTISSPQPSLDPSEVVFNSSEAIVDRREVSVHPSFQDMSLFPNVPTENQEPVPDEPQNTTPASSKKRSPSTPHAEITNSERAIASDVHHPSLAQPPESGSSEPLEERTPRSDPTSTIILEAIHLQPSEVLSENPHSILQSQDHSVHETADFSVQAPLPETLSPISTTSPSETPEVPRQAPPQKLQSLDTSAFHPPIAPKISKNKGSSRIPQPINKGSQAASPDGLNFDAMHEAIAPHLIPFSEITASESSIAEDIAPTSQTEPSELIENATRQQAQPNVRVRLQSEIQSPLESLDAPSELIPSELPHSELPHSELPHSELPLQGFSVGGAVTTTGAQSGKAIAPSDIIPAMLTPGEFVINARDAQKHLPLLRQINQGESIDAAQPAEIPLPATNIRRQRSLSIAEGLGIESGRSIQSGGFEDVEATEPVAYSSPPRIFRTTAPTSPSAPASFSSNNQWSSVTDLLNLSLDPSSATDWGQSHFPEVAKPIQTAIQRHGWQGFAEGGEVTSDAPTSAPAETMPVAEVIPSEGGKGEKQESKGDVDALVQEIYQRLCQRLEIERERRGVYSGRSPW